MSTANPRTTYPGSLTDVAGIEVGHFTETRRPTGCSVVITRYGIPEAATGTIAVVGPTRMPYNLTIPTVYYLSSILSQLVAGLYGHELPAETEIA